MEAETLVSGTEQLHAGSEQDRSGGHGTSHVASVTSPTNASSPSPPRLSPRSEQCFFQVTSWIYQTAEAEERNQSPPVASETPTGNKTDSSVISMLSKVRKRYLISRDRSDPGYRKKLREAIQADPRAFYYYKQRRLSKPPEYSLRAKSRLPSLFGSSTPRTPVSPKLYEPPHTPDFRPAKQAISRSVRLSVTPRRERPTKPSGGSVLQQILNKCEGVKTAKETMSTTERERELRRRVERKMEWTRETLDLVDDCEAKVLIPFYKHQKEALVEFHRDILRLSEVHRRSDSHQTSLYLHRLLRKNRNQIL